MTNTSEIAASSKKRKILVWGVAAGVILAAVGVGATIAESNYQAETRQLCAVATKAYAAAWKDDAKPSGATADAALEGAQDAAVQKALPGASAYSKRPAVKADTAKKIEARPSADELIRDVRDRSAEVVKYSDLPECEERDDVATLTKSTKALKADSAALTASAKALTADVAAFTADEKKRIAAERAAAAKKAAAAKAARERAAQEAAAAQQPAPSGGGEGGGYVPPAGDGGGGYVPAPVQPGPAPGPAPAPGGGGSGGGGGGGGIAPPPGGGGGCPPGMNCNV